MGFMPEKDQFSGIKHAENVFLRIQHGKIDR
jgi:hypothetical protein